MQQFTTPPSIHQPHRRLAALIRIPSFTRQAFLISLLISSVLMLAVLVAYFPLQPEVPLFYTLPEADRQLAQKQWLFVIPGISFLITAAHVLIVNVYRDYVRLLLQLFAWTTVAMQTLLALALLRILLIVI